jgi:hypothetical protein
MRSDRRFTPFRVQMGAMRVCVTTQAPDGSEVTADAVSQHVVGQLCGQLREDMSTKFDRLPLQARTSLVVLYMFAQLVFWLLLEIIERVDGRFVLTTNAERLDACRLYFFGHELARQSRIADALAQINIIKRAASDYGSLEKMSRRDWTLIDSFIDETLEKYFGCHPHFLASMQGPNEQKFGEFRRRSALICYLFLRSQEELVNAGQSVQSDLWATFLPTKVTVEELLRVGFSNDEIQDAISASEAALQGEQLVRCQGDGTLSVGDLNLKYALVAYSNKFFEGNAAYGNWFEKDYIRNYLKKRLAGSRYAILQGFKSGSDEEIKYDVDVTIFDCQFNRLYFVQIKHRGKTLLPYLRDELKEFSEGQAVIKAVAQLKPLKENASSRKLRDQIKTVLRNGGFSVQHIDVESLCRQSGLIVVHSIENFDFSMKDGVAMYEWNTFRNLLRETVVRCTANDRCEVRVDLGGLRLDEPAQVAAAYTRWHDGQHRPQGQPSLSEILNSKEHMRCEVVSTRHWQIFGRWKLVRPYLYLQFPVV